MTFQVSDFFTLTEDTQQMAPRHLVFPVYNLWEIAYLLDAVITQYI